jgi:hypothetical protein
MALEKRQIGWIAGALVIALLAYAWVDGGEEPLRPIVEPVRVPEHVR